MYVPEVDYVMGFEERGAFLIAYDIDVNTMEELPLNPEVTKYSRGYAQAGGVMGAIVHAVGPDYKTMNVEGLDKKNQTLLKSFVKKPEAQFVEVMACEGGCVNGPCSFSLAFFSDPHLTRYLSVFYIEHLRINSVLIAYHQHKNTQIIRR